MDKVVYNRVMKDISEETLNHYLAIANKKYGDELSMEEIKLIFNVTIKDFKNNKLYLELFGHVCDYLWTKAHVQKLSDPQMEEFVQLLYWVAEADYNIRHINDETTKEIVLLTLKSIHDYKHD